MTLLPLILLLVRHILSPACIGSAPSLEELDVNNEEHQQHNGDDRAVLAVDRLHPELLGSPLEILRPVREVRGDARDVCKFTPSVKTSASNDSPKD